MSLIHAHSRPGQPEADWEPLAAHAAAVACLTAQHAAAFGWERVGGLLGQLHDIGKVSAAFQAHIRAPAGNPRCDHSTAGARVAADHDCSKDLARVLAYAIAGHHAGLADAARLDERLDASRTTIPPYPGWEHHVGRLPEQAALRPARPMERSRHACFEVAFLTRMLFSCLVDADFIATERFYADGEAVPLRWSDAFTLPRSTSWTGWRSLWR